MPSDMYACAMSGSTKSVNAGPGVWALSAMVRVVLRAPLGGRLLLRLRLRRRRGLRGHRIAGRLDLVAELFAKISLGREDAFVRDLQLFRFVVLAHLTRV